MKHSRIILTPGEPAGIGPDIIIKAAQQSWPNTELVVIGDSKFLTNRAKLLDLPLTLTPFKGDAVSQHPPGSLSIVELPLNRAVTPGVLDVANADYVLRSLEIASDLCQQQIGNALVTGPVHKGILNDAGILFSGHTEFFAQRCGVKQSIMLFVTPQTKVALATTHLPLADVPKAITKENLKTIIRLLHAELMKKFDLSQPKILVCGLNPHAGEQGHLGCEEIEIIIPALEELRLENISANGPFAADTIFTQAHLKNSDAILAMYHDQALPVVKYMSFGHAINVTLGLPYVRTSVDHGVALDAASNATADAGSITAAIQLAIQLTHQEL